MCVSTNRVKPDCWCCKPTSVSCLDMQEVQHANRVGFNCFASRRVEVVGAMRCCSSILLLGSTAILVIQYLHCHLIS